MIFFFLYFLHLPPLSLFCSWFQYFFKCLQHTAFLQVTSTLLAVPGEPVAQQESGHRQVQTCSAGNLNLRGMPGKKPLVSDYCFCLLFSNKALF